MKKTKKRTAFNLRTTPAELKDMRKEAKKLSLTMSGYIRHLHLNHKGQ